MNAGFEEPVVHDPTDLLMARIRAAQQLTPEQRILVGIEQSELAISVVRDGIRDRPAADAATVERLGASAVDHVTAEGGAAVRRDDPAGG